MNDCRFCDACFTSRQARWRHENYRCANAPSASKQNGGNNYGQSTASSVSNGDTVTDDRSQSIVEVESGSDSTTELESSDLKIVSGYTNEMIHEMVDDSGDASGFITETILKLRQYKALRETEWFMKINSDVNHLLFKNYDLDEAIKAVIANRKGFLHHLFFELRSSDSSVNDEGREGSQPDSSSDAESLTDSSDVDSEGSGTEKDKIMKTYKQSLLKSIANESGDKYNFVNEVTDLVCEYKAIRQSDMFQKLLTTTKRLIRRGYNVHEAISKAVRKRKFLVSGTYLDEKNKRVTEAKLASYNNIITNYS